MKKNKYILTALIAATAVSLFGCSKKNDDLKAPSNSTEIVQNKQNKASVSDATIPDDLKGAGEIKIAEVKIQDKDCTETNKLILESVENRIKSFKDNLSMYGQGAKIFSDYRHNSEGNILYIDNQIGVLSGEGKPIISDHVSFALDCDGMSVLNPVNLLKDNGLSIEDAFSSVAGEFDKMENEIKTGEYDVLIRAYDNLGWSATNFWRNLLSGTVSIYKDETGKLTAYVPYDYDLDIASIAVDLKKGSAEELRNPAFDAIVKKFNLNSTDAMYAVVSLGSAKTDEEALKAFEKLQALYSQLGIKYENRGIVASNKNSGFDNLLFVCPRFKNTSVITYNRGADDKYEDYPASFSYGDTVIAQRKDDKGKPVFKVVLQNDDKVYEFIPYEDTSKITEKNKFAETVDISTGVVKADDISSKYVQMLHQLISTQ